MRSLVHALEKSRWGMLSNENEELYAHLYELSANHDFIHDADVEYVDPCKLKQGTQDDS